MKALNIKTLEHRKTGNAETPKNRERRNTEEEETRKT